LQLKDSVQLQWSTASELNNRGFYIERKYDSDWLRIGYIPGSGTTTLTQHYSFLDNTLKVPANTDVAYRLVQTDFDGREKEISIIHIKFGNIPREFRLEQNYPNPFNPATTINYQLAQDVQVELKVFDVIGNLVAVLINAKQDAGSYNYQFDASRYHLSSGVYLYQLKAGNFESIRKMMLVK
jgi:hypothetical protein